MKKINTLIIICMLGLFACNLEESQDFTTEITEIENGLLKYIQVKGDSVQTYNILERMEHYKVPGMSIAVVKDGKLRWAKGYGIANTETGKEVDKNTLFQAGSISKPIAALAALKLVEEDKIDLDTDVNTYLNEWKVPENKYTQIEKVTLRRLLTHSAGMTVHGFPGYQQTDSFPTIEMVLNGEGNTNSIYVDTIPGSIWRYSGGGYTVMEKIVEDVSGLPLEKYMSQNFFESMGMINSTYQQPLGSSYHSNASAAYNTEGELIEGLWHNYPEQAAAGLWTTPSDLATYCIEVQNILLGKENGMLSQNTIEMMLTKHKNNWGLGPYLNWDNDSLTFGHGGKNAGFTNDFLSFAHKGNAVIVMTNADNGGNIIREILRAISGYYEWGIRNQRIIETIELSVEELNQFTGQYKLNFQIPDIGDYIIDISIKNDKLFVMDPNNGESNELVALKKLEFIDLEAGDEIEFQINDKDEYNMLWNNQYLFEKISK